MIHVKEALALVLERALPTAPRELAVSDALGSILAENIVSDIDSPPHEKSLMDGYAVFAADLASGIVDQFVAANLGRSLHKVLHQHLLERHRQGL